MEVLFGFLILALGGTALGIFGWGVLCMFNYGMFGRSAPPFILWPRRSPWLYKVIGPVYVRGISRDRWFPSAQGYILGVFPLWLRVGHSLTGYGSEADAWEACKDHEPRKEAERRAKGRTTTITTKEIGNG